MKKTPPSPLPVTLVQVVLAVHADGTVSVHADQAPVPPPSGIGVWRRGDFTQIIDTASNDRAVPVRITVRESDGSTFTDLLPAIVRRTTAPVPDAPGDSAPAPEPEEEPAPAGETPVDIAVTGEGFLPGEDLAVALVTGRAEATEDGRVRVVIDPDHIAALTAREVVLVGRTSGTLTVRSLS